MIAEHSEKVLVVDDSSFMRQIVIRAVNGAGFSNVIGAEDGSEAIELYEKERPDIMLMDLIMPNVTGLEVLRALVPKGAKIIVISAIGQKSIIDDAFKMGAKGYFIKPFFAVSEIKVMIESVLKGEIVRPDHATSDHLEEYMEVAKNGADKSSNALSTILGEKVDVVMSGVTISDTAEKFDELGSLGDGMVTAVTGLLVDVPGATYISLLKKDAFSLVDLLNKRDIGTTTSLEGNIDRSTIKEILNILSNSYLSVFDELRIDMLAAELPHIIERNELKKYVEKFLDKKGVASEKVVIFSVELIVVKHAIRIQLEFLIYNNEIT